MTRKRIDPPYRAYLVSADGKKTPVHAHGIVIELGQDLELELDLAPHPNQPVGCLAVCAGPERTLADFERSGHCSSLVIRPAAGNTIHLFVERHPWCPISPDAEASGR